MSYHLILGEESDRRIRVQLVGGADGDAPLERRAAADRAEVDALAAKLTTDLLDWANRRDAPPDDDLVQRRLRRSGSALFQVLLGEVGDRLRALAGDSPDPATAPYLHVHLDAGLARLPVELLHDGEGFLVDRFRMGRRVATGGAASAAGRGAEADRPRKPGPPSLLLIADPTDDPDLRADVELEFDLVRRRFLRSDNLRVRPNRGRAVTATLLREEVPESGVVHFLGHDVGDGSGAWRLAGGAVFGPEDVRRLPTAPLLVFANACRSARAADFDTDVTMVRAFLERGSRAFVGTWWEVHSRASAHFAGAFHDEMANGASVGTALAAGRRAVVDRFGPGEVVWASYVLYGDPEVRLVPGEAPDRLSTDRDPDAPARRPAAKARASWGSRAGILVPATLILTLGLYLRFGAGGDRRRGLEDESEGAAAADSAAREARPGEAAGPEDASRRGEGLGPFDGVGTEQSASVGYATFLSSPSGCHVVVDGVRMGETPITLELEGGLREIRLEREGYRSWAGTIRVEPGTRQDVTASLVEASG